MLRALIICVSGSTGNTSRVAGAMASVLNADVVHPDDIDPADLAGYDIVGFGSGIYFGSHHSRLRRFVTQLQQAPGTWAFVFATAGMGHMHARPWQPSLEQALDERGFSLMGAYLCRGFDTWLPLRFLSRANRGHPDDADLTRARAFAEMVATRATHCPPPRAPMTVASPVRTVPRPRGARSPSAA